MDSFDYRKPRPDIPILPQSALYRTEPLKPFKRPKGRKGRKPRGAKLKPRDLSQFNKFHTEAARNKERDRAEKERVDKIRERDEARRERSGRLQIEDRRYAAKVITEARDRAAERDFRREQLRLLRQQQAAPPPAINIAPAAVEVRPVINLPAAGGGGGGGDAREEARRFAAFREQVQGDIRRGLGGLQEEIERIGQAQRGGLTPEQSGRLIADRQIRELEERTAEREREREERTAAQLEQLQRDREEAVQRARDEEGLRAAQAQRDLLQQTQARVAEEREAGQAAQQEITTQLSRAQTARNQAEDRARANQARAEELERHNQTLQQQRDSATIAPLADGSQFLTQQDRDEEIAERFSDQYRDLVLRQATREQRGDRQFLARLEQFQDRVEQEYKFPLAQEGREISDEDRPFYLNPYRPENEKFLRERLAESRVIQGGLSDLRGEAGIKKKVKLTQQQVDREIEVVKRLEREEQRRRLGRGQIQPFYEGFSSSEEEEIDLGLGAVKESPREQAQRQALERQSSQEKVKRVLTAAPEPELEPEQLDSSLESLESEQDNWELVSSNFDAGNKTQFHLKGKPHKLNPQLSHFTFRDDEGWVGKGQGAGRFKGEDLVIVNVNPDDGNVKVRKKDAMREGEKRQRKDIEANIKFKYLRSLIDQGEVNLKQIDHTLQPVEQPSLVGRAAEAVGGAAATVGGVVGNAALGAARGVGGAVYDRLPSAADIGEAAGRGGVAAASGVAGVVRGAVQAALSPREPAIGEQTGGALPVGFGLVESDED